MAIIFEPISFGAELEIQTIFVIQFQISRQTFPQFKLKAGHVLLFQQEYHNSSVMKYWP